MTRPEFTDVVVVGAGAAGIGTGVALSRLDLEILILERDEIGASFRRWPDEMRFITPSFPSNSFRANSMSEPKRSPVEPERDPRERPRSGLLAFVRTRNTVESCTLFPPTAVAPHRTDAWIRATGDAFDSLEAWR